MRFATILAMLLSLAGCAEYDNAREANMAAAANERLASDDASCRSSGAERGSPVYDDCRKRLENQHAQETHSQQHLANQMLNDTSALRPYGQ
jgi:hypothetical protein